MAKEIKKLDSIIQVDNEEYAVIAEEAKVADKVAHKLEITIGNTNPIEFDGSKDVSIDIAGGDADSAEKAKEIEVHLDNNQKEYAIITISKNDPTDTDGELGDIWFKYI